MPKLQPLLKSSSFDGLPSYKCKYEVQSLQLRELGEITESLGVSKKSVDRWFDNYEVHGQVD